MPTRLCSLLLLATLAPAVGVAAEPGDSQTVVPTEVFLRIRPQTVSHGPAGVRRVDPSVEPASFQSFGTSKPLPSQEPTPQTKPSAVGLDGEAAGKLVVSPTAEPAILTDLSTPKPPNLVEPATLPSGEDDQRRLLVVPKSDPSVPAKSASLGASPFQSLMEWRPSSKTLTATGGGLAIAVGLLLVTTWLIRSCAPKSSRQLPSDVVEVLGRLPLGGKQMTQLVRVGSKLVLIAITPDGAKTLTEITDPDEVARLIAACDAKTGRGSTADFDRLLNEMADQRTAPGFLEDGDTARPPTEGYGFADGAFDPRSLAAAYANTPGGRENG